MLQCLRYFICFDFQRVKIFHKWVENDKQSLGISTESSRPTALLNIRRSRILEVSVQTPFLKPLLRSLFVKDYKPNLCLAKLISLSNKIHIWWYIYIINFLREFKSIYDLSSKLNYQIHHNLFELLINKISFKVFTKVFSITFFINYFYVFTGWVWAVESFHRK